MCKRNVSKCHCTCKVWHSCTVIEIVDDLSFEQLFSKIKAGCFERVVKMTEELRLAVVKGVYVGSSKESSNAVSVTASIFGVCSAHF